MLFDVSTGWQWLGLILVFAGLVITNEITRRSKAGGIAFLFVIPAAVTVYCIVVAIAAANGAEWAINNETHTEMGSWFHYAKMYAALAGCIGFMMIRYDWGIAKKKWFVFFPYAILSINILIAICSDFESAIRAMNGWWQSNEGVWLYGGWHNIMNGIAGILNIIGITSWTGIYISKDKRDMLWPDMIWVYIIAYDIWNFAYTYNNLPSHSWYCGLALLLAPTVAAFIWTKGAWLANRAHTLAIWCMFAQICPMFQNHGKFAVATVMYCGADPYGASAPTSVNATPMTVISALALIANIALVVAVVVKAVKAKKNPYTNDMFTSSKDYKIALERAASAARGTKSVL